MLNIKKNKLSLRDYSNLYIYIPIVSTLTACIIALFTLFSPPMPGIADQGDFERVMKVTGLGNTKMQDASHWFKYVVTEYEALPTSFSRLSGEIPTTSMIYPITIGKLLCSVIGYNYFDTRILAFIYLVLYMTGLYICLRCIHFKNISTAIFFSILSVFVLVDGNYLVWFNSLYGEPMMIVGFLLFISSILYLLKHREDKPYKKFLFIFISSVLFLGSKAQCFIALPLVVFIILRVIKINRKQLFTKTNIFLIITILALTFYVKGTYSQINASCGVDTKFNSVFYGILKNSQNPKEDLELLGLSPDLSVEAGKHAYLPKEAYVKYVPWSDITNKEFNEKISNIKLVKFYILQPDRLLKGMEYTASKSFHTETALGKYEKSKVPKYTPEFNRFTLWSDFRNFKLPKTLSFIVTFYILIFLFSVIEYIKHKHDAVVTLRIEILWIIILIGIMQFPMPYIGNGEADTAKQLFLFNYTFDITFLAASTWIFNKLVSLKNR
ncbi:hypothetical protein [Clostridium magnum]|uniref:Glycosyltransferase RgtA/B/C/D-like domain-containing protein n=1 Tax=Clostridium magnum DSM 2767 TaxID=1121326 RepID=A0A162SY54_9CLOT|nr:hypothetical protein [Clostridium magnum]KZL92017.1 hypothetical protein CLMAG_18230 [Clostridium magnum DSM 2767]SHH25781.1 hypothetical protein SAMN02745944_00410 [Clostridium magnum DSM 2767]